MEFKHLSYAHNAVRFKSCTGSYFEKLSACSRYALLTTVSLLREDGSFCTLNICNVYNEKPQLVWREFIKQWYARIDFFGLETRSITPGGGVLSPKLYVDVPAGPRKSDYLYTNFLPNFPPISIPFSKEKHPIWIKLGAFYNNLPKIHPIYVIWAPSSLMKTPWSLYQISRKGAPRGRHIYVYHVNVRTPPPPGSITLCYYKIWLNE